MSGYVSYRSGWDAPARIATTAELLTQASETLPGEPMYQPIPFYPAITSGSGASLGAGTDEVDTWANTPGRVDLSFYQGDDVVVPLTIQDPSDPLADMSQGWEWFAQIRVLHSYHSTLHTSFAVKDEYTPPAGEELGFTQVTLYLPRSENLYIGTYRWDLYSLSPFDSTGFSQPPEVVDPEPWPTTDRIRTWLYGLVRILPRVTATDVLDDDLVTDEEIGATLAPFPFVGPNGRVP